MIGTISGELIDPFSPNPHQIHPRDIVTSLCHTNRYNGMTRRPYSVGQHTVAMMEYMKDAGLTDPLLRSLVLVHDFPEYVLGDVVSPLKKALLSETDVYAHMEQRMNTAIHQRFNLDRYHATRQHEAQCQALVGEYDKLAHYAEVYVLDLPDRAFGSPKVDGRMIRSVRGAEMLDIDTTARKLHGYIEELLDQGEGFTH